MFPDREIFVRECAYEPKHSRSGYFVKSTGNANHRLLQGRENLPSLAVDRKGAPVRALERLAPTRRRTGNRPITQYPACHGQPEKMHKIEIG